MAGPGSALEVFVVSLRLGLTSFGGPIAHIGYQRRAFVETRGWLSDAAFADLVALAQTLPGPASSQLSIAVGRLRAGWSGALAAWLGFTLPSAIAMTLLGVWAVGTGIPTEGAVAGAVAGLKAAAVAVVAHAVLAMARRLTPDAPRVALAAAAALVMLAVQAAWAQGAMIALGALVGWVAWRGAGEGAGQARGNAGRSALRAGGRRTALALAFVVVVGGSQAVALVTGDTTWDFTAAVVRAGALVFGGGHVVLPLLEAGVVAPGFVTDEAFLAGYGAAQAVPGPLFTFASYLGAVSAAGPGGVAGAALATVAIFLPGALLVLAALPVLGALAHRPGLAGALRGVNAVVVGILAAALVSPVGTSGITSPLSAAVAGLGTGALLSGRVPPVVVVAAAAAVMAAAAA
ncbi:MAG TPA: chromate efflux transporter [Candidatus Limnocylindrales bacterium]|nr:chromate efflux transporter [Candidatus Limnocylindrales bacterium]